MTENDFAYKIVFLALLYVFPYLIARRSHTTSFCRACVPGGHISDGFWAVWEGPSLSPTLTRRRFQMPSQKGVKNRFFRTDAHQCPSTVTHLGHIVVVLRRSPASVTSSSPSQRRRADGTLPRPQLDQEFEGRHRAERVLIAEVPCIQYLDRLDRGGSVRSVLGSS